jgi:hypothetical protein
MIIALRGNMCTHAIKPCPAANSTHGCRLTTRGNGGRDVTGRPAALNLPKPRLAAALDFSTIVFATLRSVRHHWRYVQTSITPLQRVHADVIPATYYRQEAGRCLS